MAVIDEEEGKTHEDKARSRAETRGVSTQILCGKLVGHQIRRGRDTEVEPELVPRYEEDDTNRDGRATVNVGQRKDDTKEQHGDAAHAGADEKKCTTA
jgi:hypothetical protein